MQEEAENGDEIPDEEEEQVISKENVVVTVPADFTLSESCMELMNQLAATIYKYALAELARAHACKCRRTNSALGLVAARLTEQVLTSLTAKD